jgi:thioredoxin
MKDPVATYRSAMTVHTADEVSFDALIAETELAIVDLGGRHCPPCRTFAPVFARASEAHPDVRFVNVDVDESPSIARRFGVRAIPTIIVLRRGEPIATRVGLMHPHQLEELLSR